LVAANLAVATNFQKEASIINAGLCTTAQNLAPTVAESPQLRICVRGCGEDLQRMAGPMHGSVQSLSFKKNQLTDSVFPPYF